MENVVLTTLSGSQFALCASKGFAIGFIIGFSGFLLSFFRRCVKATFVSTLVG